MRIILNNSMSVVKKETNRAPDLKKKKSLKIKLKQAFLPLF